MIKIEHSFGKVGAGWNNTSKGGKEYISLRFDDDFFDMVYKEDILKRVCVFPNKFKKEAKHPDYYIGAPVNKNDRTNLKQTKITP